MFCTLCGRPIGPEDAKLAGRRLLVHANCAASAPLDAGALVPASAMVTEDQTETTVTITLRIVDLEVTRAA